MVRLNLSVKLPRTTAEVITLLSGLLTLVLWSTQYFWNWYGANQFDRTFYSLLVLFCAGLSVGMMYAVNFKPKSSPYKIAITTALVIVIAVILTVMLMNGGFMMMDATYGDFVNERGRGGYFYGIEYLSTAVTQQDVDSLTMFAKGISELVRSLFLIVPGLIGTWGGLGVLMAGSMQEASIGIMAILAAMVVFFVVWIFHAIDVTLMMLSVARTVITLTRYPTISIIA